MPTTSYFISYLLGAGHKTFTEEEKTFVRSLFYIDLVGVLLAETIPVLGVISLIIVVIWLSVQTKKFLKLQRKYPSLSKSITNVRIVFGVELGLCVVIQISIIMGILSMSKSSSSRFESV